MKVKTFLPYFLLFWAGCAPLVAQATSPAPALQKIASIAQEEFEPINFVISASGIDPQTVWQLLGTDAGGKNVSVNALSATALDASTWQIAFPGQPQGKYYIHATDPAGNQAVLPDALVVTEHSPIITGLTPKKADAQTPFQVELSGKYLGTDGQVELVANDGGKAYPGTLKVQKDSPTAQGQFTALPPGVYTLKFTSAKGKASLLPAAFQVLNPVPGATKLESQDKFRMAAVTGTNLTEGMKVSLVGASGKKELRVIGKTPEGLTILYPDNLAPGTYDLVLTNNQGKEGTLKQALEIKPEKRHEFAQFWAALGTDLGLTKDGGMVASPQASVGFNLTRNPGVRLGAEAGVGLFLEQFPLSPVPPYANKPYLFADEWLGWTILGPNNLNFVTFRIPVGLVAQNSTKLSLFSGLAMDYEVNDDWAAEFSLKKTIGDNALDSMSVGFSVLRAF